MKRLLLCGYDNAMAPLGDLTAPLQQAYASKHGYDFKCHRIYSKDVMPYWQKLYFVRDALLDYQEVHWMDSDILITNPAKILDQAPFLQPGLHCSRDWGVDATEPLHISTCHFLITHGARYFIEDAIAFEKEWPKNKLYDQDAVRAALAEWPKAKDWLHVNPRRTFNAVPIEVHPSTPEPWQPGDFSCHLTMLPMDERIALFHKIREMTK